MVYLQNEFGLNQNDELNSVRLKIEIEQLKRIDEISLQNKKIKIKDCLELHQKNINFEIISRKVYLNQSLINLDKRQKIIIKINLL